MIVASLKHADRQSPGTEGLSKAFAFLRRPGLAELADGRYPIDGDRVYALAQRYSTEAGGAEPRFEAHRDFIDVQYLVAGSEVIGWAPLSAVEISEPYDSGKDACFGRARGWTPVRLGPGDLAVLYPEDAHAPRLADGAPGPVAKIVVKVSVADGI
ncbi:MAG: YhcH/YjgK/YiaL family protein [Elusimicrobia bacterium]|nr:YhcH/YjgK/YiaL family protein [Elusimicrobiota bacterium]MDA8244872.1 YhcH/YjgK/YiaL family protein [Elusimicrobiota bacterium]